MLKYKVYSLGSNIYGAPAIYGYWLVPNRAMNKIIFLISKWLP